MTGQRIGCYEVLEKIGEGGMGQVWKARDPRLRRLVAIKVVRGADPRGEERLWKEARVGSRVSHPNLCQLFDVIEDEAHVYLVMELLEGRPLSTRIAEGPIPLAEAAAILKSTLDALSALHHPSGS